MPVQRSWVEHWLDRYCPPESHRYAAWHEGTRHCLACRKEELASIGTCVICGLPGIDSRVLSNARRNVAALKAVVCGICRDEFELREVIRGWRATSA